MDVSVVVLTYNHEPYIGEALESVLTQQTSLTYEVLISEDRSTDRTRDIVIDYARRFPDRIRLFLSEKNQNDMEVFSRAYEAARGEFVAYLDGDDYWMPEKLERQVRFLREHTGCPMCFHPVAIVGDRTQATSDARKAYGRHWLDISEMCEVNHVAAGSALFRRAALGALPSWFAHLPYVDWPVSFLLAEQGRIGYVDEVLGAWRHHDGGVWTSANDVARARWDVAFFTEMERRLRVEHRVHAERGLVFARERLDAALWAAGDRRGALRVRAQALRSLSARSGMPTRARLKGAVRTIAPNSYSRIKAGAGRLRRRL